MRRTAGSFASGDIGSITNRYILHQGSSGNLRGGGSSSLLSHQQQFLSGPAQVSPHAQTGSKGSGYNSLVENGDDAAVALSPTSTKAASDKRMLVWSFVAMVVVGLGNKIFQKLQTLPMHNYPNFLNLLTTFMYIPLSFMYVIPAIKKGWIRQDNLEVPKRDFAVMGFLDSLAGIMQVFAATYLPGALLILLMQGAIPVSMALSRCILKAKYHVTQYISAVIVMGGIILVLAPSLFGSGGGGSILWSGVLVGSCIPMCLSSIYKEVALGAVDLDPVYMNGWVAVFQFIFSIPLSVPAALAGEPPVSPDGLPLNLWQGLKCYFGINSIGNNTAATNGTMTNGTQVYPDHCSPNGPLFVNIYLVFNVSYNILIIFILKYGSANVLWLAMTVMVPLGNLAFALPFMPGRSDVTPFDLFGLLVIMAGLVGYRQGPFVCKDRCPMPEADEEAAQA